MLKVLFIFSIIMVITYFYKEKHKDPREEELKRKNDIENEKTKTFISLLEQKNQH